MAATDRGPLSAPEGRSASRVLEEAGEATSGSSGAAHTRSLETQLLAAGLKPLGRCEKLSQYGEDLLRTSPMLQDMTAAEVDILGAAMVLVRAAPGQVLIREGEAGDWMMIVLKGTVDVSKRVEARQEALPSATATNGGDSQPASAAPDGEPGQQASQSRIAVIQRGAAVGDMSMLDSEPRYATCTAIGAVEAGVLGRHAVALLIRDHPAVGAKVLVKITQLMAQRLRNISNQLVKLLRKK